MPAHFFLLVSCQFSNATDETRFAGGGQALAGGPFPVADAKNVSNCHDVESGAEAATRWIPHQISQPTNTASNITTGKKLIETISRE